MHRKTLSFGEDDGLSLKSIISEYTKILYNFIRRFGFSNEEAEDILQDIFIKVWKHKENFDEEKSSFKTWIFTLAKNTVYDALRKKINVKIINSLDDDTLGDIHNEIEDASADIIRLLERVEFHKEIVEAINSLNENEKTILLLHVEESLTFNELATIFDSPLNTIKSNYRRSLAKLKKYLEEMHQNSD